MNENHRRWLIEAPAALEELKKSLEMGNDLIPYNLTAKAFPADNAATNSWTDPAINDKALKDWTDQYGWNATVCLEMTPDNEKQWPRYLFSRI